MKLVIPGGSGQVGTVLARAFAADGHEVMGLGRKAAEEARSAAAVGVLLSVSDLGRGGRRPVPPPARVAPRGGVNR
jgi:predicted dinucleotide-binding enzyme